MSDEKQMADSEVTLTYLELINMPLSDLVKRLEQAGFILNKPIRRVDNLTGGRVAFVQSTEDKEHDHESQ